MVAHFDLSSGGRGRSWEDQQEDSLVSGSDDDGDDCGDSSDGDGCGDTAGGNKRCAQGRVLEKSKDLLNKTKAKVLSETRKRVTGSENKKVREFVTEQVAVQRDLMKKTYKRAGAGAGQFVKNNKEAFKRKQQAFEAKLFEPQYIKLADRLAFTLGVIATFVTQYVLLVHEAQFWYYYAFMAVALIGLKLYLYIPQKFGFFLLDFCYYVNLVAVILLLYPRQATAGAAQAVFGSVEAAECAFFKVVFIMTNGPVAIAIPVWKNR